MKTAISIPDKVFAEAERLSRRLKKSRSQVYTEAVTEYIARHDPEALTEAMNQVCEAVDTYPDPVISAAARRTLEGVEWKDTCIGHTFQIQPVPVPAFAGRF